MKVTRVPDSIFPSFLSFLRASQENGFLSDEDLLIRSLGWSLNHADCSIAVIRAILNGLSHYRSTADLPRIALLLKEFGY